MLPSFDRVALPYLLLRTAILWSVDHTPPKSMCIQIPIMKLANATALHQTTAISPCGQ
jgi:hypothetical protein